MTARVIPVAAFTLVVFGASGDLARRKLYPALWRRRRAGQAPAGVRVIGAARQEMTDEAYRAMVRCALEAAGALATEGGAAAASEDEVTAFLQCFSYARLDATEAAGWSEFAAALRELPRPQLFYFAVAPALAAPLCERLHGCGALESRGGECGGGRLVMEKPFGRDAASAHALNETVRAAAPERDIYRIDHYLGKETVQNLMALRFANALFEPMWNARAIDHVQITVAESIGAGGRGGYYDRAGAARDMLQNHLMQLLCLTAMEVPAKYMWPTACAMKN